MDKLKPKIFIASSVEGLNVAYALQENLDHIAELTVWPQGIFDLMNYTLDDIITQLGEFDYGIFVFSFEDLSIIRQEKVETTRDNVLFELGLFIGRLGRQRCLIVMPKTNKKFHLPTDLLGIKPGIYNPRSDDNLLSALGPVSNQIRRLIKHQGLRKKKETPLPNFLAQQIDASGLTAFYQSRKDYAKYRTYASTIDSYIATANHSLHMVSINLMTGLTFDGICSVIERKLRQNSTFFVSISLLNPWKSELILALSPVLNIKPEKLTESIIDTFTELSKLKQKLPKKAQDRFKICAHNAIPFASAIIIDGKTERGKIQIETKPYKAPLRRSFGFEISYKANNEFFITLRDSYLLLIAEGIKYDLILKFLGQVIQKEE